MVRLEADSSGVPPLKILRFNSFMVRLEAETFIDFTFSYVVSIPLWCDWKYLVIQVL